MISPIFKSYLEQAKLMPKPKTIIGSLISHYKKLAEQMYLESLKEAETAEDNDYEPITEIVQEECPICEEEQQLRDYIRNCVINRKIKYIVVHCTATPVTATVSSILRYWRENLKWKNPGYHILFPHNGGFTVMADFDVVSNGVAGFNANSINISYIGGIDSNNKPIDNRSDSQKRLLAITIEELRNKLGAEIILVQGHRDFPKVKKACPCFNAKTEYIK
jgi:N-acetylmuramoyl-L-alanine amidase